MPAQSIPVADLLTFVHGDADDQRRFVATLGGSLVEYGFVAIENHGVDASALAGTFDQIRQLFELPTSEKLRYEVLEGGRQRGYTSFGKEQAKDHVVPDMKEFWHIGPELAGDHPMFGKLQRNLWPPEVPELRANSLRSTTACSAAGNTWCAPSRVTSALTRPSSCA
jgi:isopenicillin N synthase-like dioxygenase